MRRRVAVSAIVIGLAGVVGLAWLRRWIEENQESYFSNYFTS